jgi:hypothetical protein
MKEKCNIDAVLLYTNNDLQKYLNIYMNYVKIIIYLHFNNQPIYIISQKVFTIPRYSFSIFVEFKFSLYIYDNNKSIDFAHGKSKNFKNLDELKFFIDKKVIFEEKKISVGAVCRLSVNCVIRHKFFSFQPRHFSFSGSGILNLQLA